MCCDPRFIVDASLAGLAKWLRMLGLDSVVYLKEAGRSMMHQAQAEERIILTRRQDMMERQYSGRVLLLSETDIARQLDSVIRKLSLKIVPAKFHTRCLSCNTILTRLNRADVRDLVPEYVFANCDQYHQCPTCRKIFWPGTHGRNALQYLKDHGIIP